MQVTDMATPVFKTRLGSEKKYIYEVFKTLVHASYQLTWRYRLPERKATRRPTILETCCRQQLKYELFGWVGGQKKERFTSRKASSTNLTVHGEKSQVLFFPSLSFQVLVKVSASFRRRIFPSFSLPITT